MAIIIAMTCKFPVIFLGLHLFLNIHSLLHYLTIYLAKSILIILHYWLKYVYSKIIYKIYFVSSFLLMIYCFPFFVMRALGTCLWLSCTGAMDWIFSVTPKFIWGNPNFQSGGIRKWGFVEVIRMRAQSSQWHWCPYKKRKEWWSLFLPWNMTILDLLSILILNLHLMLSHSVVSNSLQHHGL